MKFINWKTPMLAVGMVGLTFASPTFADKPKFGDTWEFALGGMLQNADFKFSSTRDDRPEVSLDFDKLGLDDDSSTIWAGVDWQFADSWGLGFSYSSYNSDGDVDASEDGNFGDIEWTAAATLESDFDLDLYILDVKWDFINNGKTHMGIGLGLHIADMSAGIGFTLEGNVNGEPVIIESGSESTAVTAPLPNVSLHLGHTFGEKFYLGGTLGYFDLKVNDIKGELVSARAVFEWRAFKNFGFGAAYQYVAIEVKENASDRTNKINADFYGPILFVSASF